MGAPPSPERPASRETGPVDVLTSDLEHARLVGGVVFHEHDVSLPARSRDFRMRLRAYAAGDLTVGVLEYRSPVHLSTAPFGDSYQVNLPLVGRVAMTYGGDRVEVSPRLGGIHGWQEETEVEGWGEPARILGIKIPRHTIEASLEALLGRPAEEPVVFDGTIDLRSRAGQEWKGAVQLVARGLAAGDSLLHNPLVARPAAESLVRGLLLAARHNYSPELSGEVTVAGPDYLRAAVDVIRRHAAEPLTVQDIAARVHVSVRSLQAAFREHLATTPMQALRDERLDRVRAELLDAGGVVGQVAARWGFAHPGRFAVHYAQRFGESPSETTRRRRP